MAIRITCPSCQTSLTLDDEMRGRKVRCRSCEHAISIPSANGVKRKRDLEEATQNGAKVKVKAAPARVEEDEEEDEAPRPTKKKKKKKKRSSNGLVIGIVAGVAGLVIVVGLVSLYLLLRREPPAPEPQPQIVAKNDPVPPPPEPFRIAPKIQEGNPAAKVGGNGIVRNIRGAVYRTERRSELKQLGMAFIQFADEYKGAGRTMDNYLEFIKTFGPIRDAVKDGYYKVNLNGRPDSSSVLVYERDVDQGRHLCARGDASVDYVAVQDLKLILGKNP